MGQAEKLFGRSDARVRRTLIEILVQVVPIPKFSLEEILVVSVGGLVVVEKFSGQGWGIYSLHKTFMKASTFPVSPVGNQKRIGSYQLDRSLKECYLMPESLCTLFI